MTRVRGDFISVGHTLASALGGVHHVAEVGGSAGSILVALTRATNERMVIVAESSERAAAIERDLRALVPGIRTLFLPAQEGTVFSRVRPDRSVTEERASALVRLAAGEFDAVVTTAQSFVTRVPSRSAISSLETIVKVGSTLDLTRFSERLAEAGYDRLPLVEDAGSFSIRGNLVDVWAPGDESPHRIELDFDRVERIAKFDPETQRSTTSSVEHLRLGFTRESALSRERLALARTLIRERADAVNLPSSQTRALIEDATSGRLLASGESLLPALTELVPLCALLGPEVTLVLYDAGAVVDEVRSFSTAIEAAFETGRGEPVFEPASYYLTPPELDEMISGRKVICLSASSTIGRATPGFFGLADIPETALSLGTRSQEELSRRLRAASALALGADPLGPLTEAILREHEEGNPVVILSRTESQLERLGTLLEHRNVRVERRALALTDLVVHRGDSEKVSLAVLPLEHGFASLGPGPFVITEEEIFGRRKHHTPRRASRALKNALSDLRSLERGDLVVHREHGIGRYLGLEQREVDGTAIELMVIEYQGGDKLFLPVHRLGQVEKLSGAEGSPRLDRLGGQTFAKTKSDASRRIVDLADRLLTLYADRKAALRPPLPPPGDEYASFEASFPHEETSDQAAAIQDVISDLSKPEVMDRLVCGDVGFGKTEVALRAAYLNVLGGRQVALLCPTTVLAEQHFRTFEARLAGTGASVGVLSRFATKKETDRVLDGLRRGTLDVVVGTHRLLSSDVHWKRLGLLVVDEEHRFGVAHKERIKELRKGVDVLTLSATPIPRTLGLAVAGLRDMSVIATPPIERRSIRTISARYDLELVKEALHRELARGGQVYYVHAHIEGLEERAAELRSLIPGIRVAALHGRMKESALEKAMLGFVDGEYDVLCATSIVESGLDIPRANTILIERADRFGLAQLYQLRGRVGRAAQKAYCYLLVPPDAALSTEGRQRIEALERYTELGSGFQVATLDMEIRGAGALLGADQSGFVERVGFELFSEMLEKAAAELGGKKYVAELDPDISLDVDTRLPETYIEDIGVRLSIYKRYATALDEAEVGEIDTELEDRFGPRPREVLALGQVMRLKAELRKFRALGLTATAKSVTLHLADDTPLAGPELMAFLRTSPGRHSISPGGRIGRRAGTNESFASGLEHARKLIEELGPLSSAS